MGLQYISVYMDTYQNGKDSRVDRDQTSILIAYTNQPSRYFKWIDLSFIESSQGIATNFQTNVISCNDTHKTIRFAVKHEWWS